MGTLRIDILGEYGPDLYRSFAMQAEAKGILFVGQADGHIYYRGRYICKFLFMPPCLILSEWQPKVSQVTQNALMENLQELASEYNEGLSEKE